MSLRKTWKFHWAGSDLLGPCAVKANHHRERWDWWRLELEKAEGQLREHGVEFRESQVTGGSRIDAVLDPQLQARVAECRNKIAEHQRQAEEYDSYCNVFGLNGDAVLELDVDDIQFFGL